jgi:hypothetical protein
MKQESTVSSQLIALPVMTTSVQRNQLSRYLLLLLITFIFMLLAGFKKESLPGSYPGQVQVKSSVPFKGQFTLTINFATGLVVGNGTASHLGKFDALGHDDLSAFPFITSTETFTAANGDELYITQQGMAQDIGNGMLSGELDATITGGTGRFAGATGSYQLHVLVNAIQGTGNATFDGTISY